MFSFLKLLNPAVLQSFIAAVLISLTLGFGGGYYTKGKFDKADVVSAIQDVRKEDANAISDAQATDAALRASEAEINSSTAEIKSEIKRYAPTQPRSCEPSLYAGIVPGGHQVPSAGSGIDYLSVGELWLLNSARSRTPDRAPFETDAEAKAPSSVDRASFIANDIDITGIYHNLAEEHNALIDYVLDLQTKQRKRLGID